MPDVPLDPELLAMKDAFSEYCGGTYDLTVDDYAEIRRALDAYRAEHQKRVAWYDPTDEVVFVERTPADPDDLIPLFVAGYLEAELDD